MAGDDRLEVEVFLRRPGCALHVHREMAAGAEDADIGLVVFTHPAHIGHDVGIARNVDHMAFARDHVAGFVTGIDRTLVAFEG
ncbi:hypothetical protein D3C76_1553420 [compost metagenome]